MLSLLMISRYNGVTRRNYCDAGEKGRIVLERDVIEGWNRQKRTMHLSLETKDHL
jgi:hypothetical protein